MKRNKGLMGFIKESFNECYLKLIKYVVKQIPFAIQIYSQSSASEKPFIGMSECYYSIEIEIFNYNCINNCEKNLGSRNFKIVLTLN